MSTSDQLSNTFLGYLNLDMSNHSYPPFPDLYDYITPPSPSVSYTLPMMPTPISSRLAPPLTPILAPQTVPDPHLLLPFHHLLSYPSESLIGTSTGNAATKSKTPLPAPAASIHWGKNRRKGRLITTIPLLTARS